MLDAEAQGIVEYEKHAARGHLQGVVIWRDKEKPQMLWRSIEEIRRKISNAKRGLDDETCRDILRLCSEWETMRSCLLSIADGEGTEECADLAGKVLDSTRGEAR